MLVDDKLGLSKTKKYCLRLFKFQAVSTEKVTKIISSDSRISNSRQPKS